MVDPGTTEKEIAGPTKGITKGRTDLGQVKSGADFRKFPQKLWVLLLFFGSDTQGMGSPPAPRLVRL